MNEPLVKRIVGASVLLILAGLLWPILFNFDDSMRPVTHDTSVSTGDEKLFEDAAKVASQHNEKITADNKRQQANSDETGLTSEPPASTRLSDSNKHPPTDKADGQRSEPIDDPSSDKLVALDEKRIPISYVIQAGTFRHWGNAKKLRGRIIEAGLKAYIRPETSLQQGPYVVAIGPYLTKRKAKDALVQIKSDFNVNDAVLRRFRDV